MINQLTDADQIIDDVIIVKGRQRCDICLQHVVCQLSRREVHTQVGCWDAKLL